MVILFILFVAQFSIACACLAFNKDQQHKLAYEGWHSASMSLRNETQIYFDCCGFENASLPEGNPMEQPSCSYVCCLVLFHYQLFLFQQIFELCFSAQLWYLYLNIFVQFLKFFLNYLICLWVLAGSNPGKSKIFFNMFCVTLYAC